MKIFTGMLVLLFLITTSVSASEKQPLQETESNPQNVVSDMNQQLAESQQTIDKLDLATRKMLQQYREILQQKDYQQYYNYQLKQLKDSQQQEIAALEQQLQELDLIEVAMMPLMQSMLSALEEFVALDIPFHYAERSAGLQKLRSRIDSGSLSLPDKYRLLMEAWQIEYDYGRSVETWRADLVANSSLMKNAQSSSQLAVNYLRVGRTIWYYMTLDEEQLAMWDKTSRSWQTLPKKFAPNLKRAMQVASEQIAPELLPLPVPANAFQSVEGIR